MELIALQTLGNGIRAGQTFTEPNPKTAEILLTLNLARSTQQDPPRLRRRGRPRRAVATEAESA